MHKHIFDAIMEASKTMPKSYKYNISKSKIKSYNFGMVQRLFTSYKGLSVVTIKYPQLWELIKEYATYMDPHFAWTTCTININVQCQPHFDKKNVGDTMIVGIGDYTGGELELVDTQELVDIKEKPYYFNGNKVKHCNAKWEGNRISLMFYTYNLGRFAPCTDV